MQDLMSKLQSVLGDEQSMKQLSEIASALSSEQPQTDKPQESSTQPDFSQLLGSLGLSSDKQPPPQPQPQQSANNQLDVSKLLALQTIMQSANKQDKNIDLLLALRPLLKEENQVKIDRLVKIFKLFAVYPALKESGLLGGDLFGLL